MGEDLLICSKLFAHAQSIACVKEALYHYRKTNPNSFCNDKSKNLYKMKSLVEVTNQTIEYLKQFSPLYDEEFDIMRSRIKTILLFMLWVIKHLEKKYTVFSRNRTVD